MRNEARFDVEDHGGWFNTARHAFVQRAIDKPIAWLVFVLILTLSLAMDAIFRAGFLPWIFSGLTSVNFVIHEFGHMAFRFAPMWIGVAAGTVFQHALPFGAIFMFMRQRDDAAACFSMAWLAISLMHSANYIADARAMDGDMTMSASFWSMTSGQPVRPEELIHDWNYLLDSVGLLEADQTIATGVRVFAGAIAAVAVLANAAMLFIAIKANAEASRV